MSNQLSIEKDSFRIQPVEAPVPPMAMAEPLAALEQSVLAELNPPSSISSDQSSALKVCQVGRNNFSVIVEQKIVHSLRTNAASTPFNPLLVRSIKSFNEFNSSKERDPASIAKAPIAKPKKFSQSIEEAFLALQEAASTTVNFFYHRRVVSPPKAGMEPSKPASSPIDQAPVISDAVELIEAPVSKEFVKQLEHLHLLNQVSGSQLDVNEMHRLNAFCTQLYHSKQEKDDAESNQPLRLMGKLLFLADGHLPELAKMIDSTHLDESIERINHFFQVKFEEMFERVGLYEESHQKAGIQDSRQVRATFLPVELAKSLVTEAGLLNSHLISHVKEKLLHIHRTLLPYETDILHVLNNLEHSSVLQEMLESIQKPISPSAPSNVLIRTLLHLDPTHIVKDVDAKRTALTGLLSHLRQGNVGSCFSTFLAIHLLANNPIQALQDFKSLLENSSLTRTIQGKKVEFPFLMRVSKETITKRLTLNPQGCIISSNGANGYIWEAPGIQSACQSLGIKTIKESMLTALSHVITEASSPPLIKISVKKLLKLTIQEAHLQGLTQAKDDAIMLEKAILAFESEAHNPLQRIWENSLAGMAETQSSGSLIPAVIESLTKTLQEKTISFNDQGSQEWDHFLTLVRRCLIDRMQLQYDPYLERTQVAADSHSTSGGFVLYDHNHAINSSNWKRIDQGVDFQSFAQSLIEDAVRLYKSENPAQNKQTLIENGIKKLSTYIHTAPFLLSALSAYHQCLGISSSHHNALNSSEHTPWVDLSGNNPIEVLNTYFERKESAILFSILPSNCHQFLRQLIDYGKELIAKKTLNDPLIHPNQTRPINVVGNHALSILFGNPGLHNACTSIDTYRWIQEHVILPGRKVSAANISSQSRKKLIQYAMTHYIPGLNEKSFNSNLLIVPAKQTIKKFRHDLINVILETIPSLTYKKKQLEKEIDTYLCQEGLSGEERERLRGSALHFADTNWGDSVHDTHFCFLINPGTGKLEMWQIQDNDTHLLPLNQDQWVMNQSWQFV